MICYSPQPVHTYRVIKGSLISGDPEAWNLAWLSHDFKKGPHPDANFTTLVRRTLQFVLKTGGIDLIDAVPTSLKVRGLLRLLPAQAVKRIAGMEHLIDTPMFSAYGAAWLEVMHERARLYREPEGPLDMSLSDLTQAQAVINALK